MVAIADVMIQHSIPAVLGSDCGWIKSKLVEEVAGTSGEDQINPHLNLRITDAVPSLSIDQAAIEFIPSIRSGSFADIGYRPGMEDEHICIDDLSAHLGSPLSCPTPGAFYGVFDGHGGGDASSYVKEHAVKLLFEDADFPQALHADDFFLGSVEDSVRRAFLLADLAMVDNSANVPTSCGTTALAALVFGNVLLVANAGDCRAVLSRKGKAVEMSQDHRPVYDAEWERIRECGGYVDDGYLNGALAVSRALGDWDMKLPLGSPSPLIAEPEFRRAVLTKDDEFLIMGCDGLWDVMSSQQAVSFARRGLLQHDDPERCARNLVFEALRLHASDNLTVVVVCFSKLRALPQGRPIIKCSLSGEGLCTLQSFLEKADDEDEAQQ